MGHEHLLPVRFAGHDIYPDVKRAVYGKVRIINGSMGGADGSLFDTKVARLLDFAGEIELDDGSGIAGAVRLETEGEKHHKGIDGVGPGNEASFCKLFWGDAFCNTALPEEVSHLSERFFILDKILGHESQCFFRKLHGLHQLMKLSEETLALVTQDFVGDKKSFREMGNLFWKSCIAEGVTPKEFAERDLIPRPDSVETFMMILSFGFKPHGAGDTRAVIQFNFSGKVQGSCHFRIEDGTISATPGSVDNPDLTIDSPFDVWVDIMTGKTDGQQMFMAQKYKVKGDLSLLIRMNQLFGK